MSGRSLVGLGVLMVLAGCGTPPAQTEEAAVPALSVESQVMDFGTVRVGEVVEQDLVLRNNGDLPLGIRSIETEGDGYTLVGVNGQPWQPNLDELLLIRPGDGATVTVAYAPTDTPLMMGALRIETGGNALVSGDIANQEDVYADPARPRFTVGLRGGSCSQRVFLVPPAHVDFGAGTPENRSATLTWLNTGTGPVDALELVTEGCDGVTFTPVGELPARVTPGLPFEVVATLDAAPTEPLSCTASLDYRSTCAGSTVWSLPTTLLAEPAVESLSLKIIAPDQGSRVPHGSSFDLALQVTGGDEPLEDLSCSIRSRRQGEEDGYPAVGSCSVETDEDGFATVTVPTDGYLREGPEVLLVRLVDRHGVSHEATLAVRIGVDAASDDADGDGFGTASEPVDCDDSDARIYSLASEVEDGLDNDCNPSTLEPSLADRDRDGVTVAGGDCDDSSLYRTPGQVEIRDERDNDCDGIVDEDTAAYDDDHDGFTELERDCNDSDPTVSPSALEICGDGIDNDCDQVSDVADPGGCLSVGQVFLGPILADRTVVAPGGSVVLRVLAESLNGEDVSATWKATEGTTEGDGVDAVWTAGSEPATEAFVQVQVEGGDLGVIWTQESIQVVDEAELPDVVTVVQE